MAATTDAIDWTPDTGFRDVSMGDTTICYTVVRSPAHPGGRVAELISLRTKTRALGQKSARRAMEAFAAEANERGFVLELAASPLNGKTNLGRLVRFYRSLGFEPTGKAVNPAGDPHMVRAPVECLQPLSRIATGSLSPASASLVQSKETAARPEEVPDMDEADLAPRPR